MQQRAALPGVLLGLLFLPALISSQEPQPSTPGNAPTDPLPDGSGVYRAGPGVSPPRLISAVDVAFSEQARKKKITATCIVALVVDADGSVRDVHVTRSAGEGQPKKRKAAAETLDQKAVQAVRQYLFAPAILHGKPVPVAINVDVHFQIY